MKNSQHQYALFRNELKKNPLLKYLFLELTAQCNLKCLHCGSSCPVGDRTDTLDAEAVILLLDELAKKTDPRHCMICVTGGEPMLHREWPRICRHAHELGFPWGMTTNGTLIDEKTIGLMEESGMSTIAVSLDGMEYSHELLRGVQGCFDKTVRGIQLLTENRNIKRVQVTTVISQLNFQELEEMHALIRSLGVDSWKLTGVEPIGIARGRKDLLLNKEQYKMMLDFIKEKRISGGSEMEVTFGCAHFLPPEYSGAVRSNHFFCGAGIIVASITCEGDIVGCLDINDRAHTVQGNIYEDDFWTVWKQKYQVFRNADQTVSRSECSSCEVVKDCQGGSMHTWNFEKGEQSLCLYR